MQHPARRTALVTGGAKRIGRAIVESLAADGWDVAFTYRSSHDAARQLVADLPDGRLLPIAADFDDPARGVAAVVSAVEAWSPRLDLLVNAAARFEPDDTLAAEAAMRVNYLAPRLLVNTFESRLKRSHGSVIHFLDILAERPMPSFSHYCASKAALWSATLADARRLAPDVRVNGIAPGVVEWHESTDAATRRRYVDKVPLRRIGTADDVTRLVRFLVNDAPFITGQVIRLDGGRSIAP